MISEPYSPKTAAAAVRAYQDIEERKKLEGISDKKKLELLMVSIRHVLEFSELEKIYIDFKKRLNELP